MGDRRDGGSHRCDFRLPQVFVHRDIGKNAFRGAFPAFVTSLTDLKCLYAPAMSPSPAHLASMLASRCMKVSPRELLQRDPAGRDHGAHGLDQFVRSHAPMLRARLLRARLLRAGRYRHRRVMVALTPRAGGSKATESKGPSRRRCSTSLFHCAFLAIAIP
jgi:hypothetical protein